MFVDASMCRAGRVGRATHHGGAMSEEEVVLSGGTLNAVARVGDTVRRPAGSWTPAVHELLRHIRRRGFTLAPEPLGMDVSGREILSFIPGETVGWSTPWPAVIRSEGLLVQVGEAVARYHRAVADFRPAGEVPWQLGTAALRDGEIVCHHDLAPYNAVLDGHRLAGIIDWDLAGPGTARSDLAFVAWQWVPLHGPVVTRMLGWDEPPERARRLRLLLDAYGLADRAGFVEEVAERIRFNRRIMVHRAAEGNAAYRALIERGHLAGMDEGLAFLAGHGQEIEAEQ
jgi:hypothetical protein